MAAHNDILTTQHSTQNDDPSQSQVTLGTRTELSHIDQKSKTAENGVDGMHGTSAGQGTEASEEKQNKVDRHDEASSADGKDSVIDKLRGSFDQSQLIAIQELMVDMSLEER